MTSIAGRTMIQSFLWATTLGAAGTGAWASRWTPDTSPAHAGIPTTPMTAPAPDAAMLARARERAIARDPFRLLRHASPVGFAISAPEQGPGMLTPTRPPKPLLVLRGVAGGPPWEAVLDGVPGREHGVVVRSGDVLGGGPNGAALRVRQVNATGVVITGMDTTWRLTAGGDAAAQGRRGP